MAEQKQAPAVDADHGKKCVFTGSTIKKVKRYYRNGKYFLNKAAFKGYEDKLKQEKAAASTEGDGAAKG